MTDFAIRSAERCPSRFGAPKTSRLNPASANGIRYERRVGKSLVFLAEVNGLVLESQPWFSYSRGPTFPTQFCAPDFILSPPDYSWILIIEAKQTFYQAAFNTLDQIYLSVVAKTYERPVSGILLCKILVPGAPKPIDSLAQYKPLASSVCHWPELSPLRW
jgi:hypothetical protein